MKAPALQRLLFITDTHYPYTIPAFYDPANPKKETPFFNFLKDFDPHLIVHGGDMLDLDCISHWNRGKPKLIEGKRLSHDYAGFNGVLDRFEKTSKSLNKFVMLEGNHDVWVEMLVEENPQAYEGIIEVARNLNLKTRGIQYIPHGKTWNIGKLFFHHGDYRMGYMPEYHARAIGQTFGRNMLYGHFHSSQSWTKVSPIDNHPIMTQCVAALCNLNPVWMKNRPSAWTNGFWVGYILPNGNFHGSPVSILNDQFVFDGTLYK